MRPLLVLLLACRSPAPVETDGEDTGAASSCDAIPTFDEGPVPSRTVHVATDGDDTTGDGSAASPFATLERAAREATPGTEIVLAAGTYDGSQYVEDLRGTADAPIWIRGAGAELRGGGEALHLTRPAFVVVEDLTLGGTAYNGLNVDDGGDYADEEAAHHVVLRRLTVSEVGGSGNEDCIKLSGLNDFHVLDSAIATCGGGGSGSGVDMVGCHRGLIARNTIEGTSGNAVQAKGGTADVEIRANVLTDAGERALNLGGSTSFEYFRPPVSETEPNAEAREIRAVANVVTGSTAPFAFVGCVDCLVANNTVLDPERWIVRILQETTSTGAYVFEPSSGGRFVNNLVVYQVDGISTHVNVGPDTEPETFTFATNLWYASDDPSRSEPELPVEESGGIHDGEPPLEEGWYPMPGGPADGAGTPLDALVHDLEGACWGEPPSVGAIEVGAMSR